MTDIPNIKKRPYISKCCHGWAYKRAEYMVKEGEPLDSGEFRPFWVCNECGRPCQIMNRHERAMWANLIVGFFGKVFCFHDWTCPRGQNWMPYHCMCVKCGSQADFESPPLEPIDPAI